MSVETTIAPRRVSDATTEPAWVRRALIAVALAFLTVFLFVPLVAVFVEASEKASTSTWRRSSSPTRSRRSS